MSRQIAGKQYLICKDKLCRTKQKLAIAIKPSAALELFNALGAQGRRFEFCRPDQFGQ